MISSRFAIPKVASLDALLLAVILVAMNFWIAPADVGWLNLNPSPYFLLPILIGGRFGFLPGIGAGAFSVVLIVTGQFFLKKVDPLSSLGSERYFFTCQLLAGGISGELQHIFHDQVKRLRERHDTFQQRVKKLEHELYFLREAKMEVDRIVATHDSGLSTLDAEIRELYLSEDERFYQKTLALLNRQAHVTDAGIYLVGANNHLTRRAVIGNERGLPEKLNLSEVEMAFLSIEKLRTVTVAEFWKRGNSTSGHYLLSAPFLDGDDRPVAVLIVTGMPFFCLNEKSVHLITVICKWASQVLEVKRNAAGKFRLVDGVETQKIFSAEILKRNVDLAFRSYQMHNLPSAVAFFGLPGMPSALQPPFERAVISCIRAGDFAAELDPGSPNLAVLLPLTGERIAKTIAAAILSMLRKDEELSRSLEHRLFIFSEFEDGERLWRELTDHAKATPDSIR